MRLHRLVGPAAILTVVSTVAVAQAPTPAARRAREVVALINNAAPAAIRAYVDSAFNPQMRGLPMQAHVDFFMGQRDRSQGLEWVEIQEQLPNGLVALVRRKLTGELAGIA